MRAFRFLNQFFNYYFNRPDFPSVLDLSFMVLCMSYYKRMTPLAVRRFTLAVKFIISYNVVNNQQDAITFSFINLFNSTLHVLGDKFAHP
jgi:hypothetical protein